MIRWKNKKGFTLAELLIVVAIIGVLVAVSIPIFNRELEKSREATDIANMRAAKALGVSAYYDIVIDGGKTAIIDGLEKKGNENAGIWYEGYYNPVKGVFDGSNRNQCVGHGTSADTDTDYGMMYKSSEDYKGYGIYVQIVLKTGNTTPKNFVSNEIRALFNGNDVGVHVQWRYLWGGNSIASEKGYDFIATY